MDIGNALKLIKRNLRKKVVESKHFQDQCIERELDKDSVKETVQKNKILGIVEQDEGLYKIWFFYAKHKNLNIIIRILPNRRLRFITIFPCLSERRKR